MHRAIGNALRMPLVPGCLGTLLLLDTHTTCVVPPRASQATWNNQDQGKTWVGGLKNGQAQGRVRGCPV